MTVTEEIKSRLDIVDVVGETVQLRKSGRNYTGFCPFHPNTRTPSFYVFPETQTWRCFGACSEGGDVFSFVMKKNNWDFKEALAELAKRAGVTLEDRAPANRAQEAIEQRLAGLLSAAAEYYHQLLLHAPQAEEARRYVHGRRLNDETVAAFSLGFALDSWDACRSHFNAQGYSDDELLQAGLLTEQEEKLRRYDRFRNRLMIPIRDATGRVVGFGARTLEPDGVPKYLNSPQTALFDKGRLLFGLDLARRHIRDAREVVLVEGYLDVMQAWQAGFRNVVAQMGTALGEAQLHSLQRYARRFVLALDADAAGASATLRSLELARQTLDRDYDVGFDVRGLARLESRLKADIRVVTLPEGYDPDKLIRTDPELWRKLLTEARPIVAYVIDVVTRDLDMNDAKAKSAAAQQILPLIGDIADPVERDHYRKLLARTLQVDEQTLLQERARQRNRQRPAPATYPKPIPPPEPEFQDAPAGGSASLTPARSYGRRRNVAALEDDFLRQLLEYPSMLPPVNHILRRHREPEVSTTDFSRTVDRVLFTELFRRLATGSVVSPIEMCDSLDEAVADRVRGLLVLPATPASRVDRLPDVLAISVLDWRQQKIKEQLALLQQLTLELEREGVVDADSAEFHGEQIRAWQQELKHIDQAKDAMSAIGRRRAEENQSGRQVRS